MSPLLYDKLFILKLSNMTRYLSGMLLFSWRLPKRKKYWGRALAWAAFCYVIAGTTPVIGDNTTLYLTSAFLVEFLLSMCVIRVCCVVDWNVTLYIACAVLSAEHIASMADSLTVLLDPGKLSFLESEIITAPILINWSLNLLVCYIAVYLLMFREKKIVGEHGLHFSTMVMLLLVSLGINLYMNMLYSVLVSDKPLWVSVFDFSVNILLSVSLLFVQAGLMRQSRTEKKLQTLSVLWEQAREQYRVSKENMEAINIKCHDLKHQLLAMKERTDEKEYASIMDMIDSYGAEIQTNNEVLDVVFQEKSFQCRKREILFTCIIDGAALDFMETTDLYVLFGNLIDNCIEAVSRLPENEVRNIQVMVRRDKGFVIVTTENPFQGELQWTGGRLRTSKPDQDNHGFGLLSIEKIVKKYDGRYSISTDDHIFAMNIVFPVKAGE